MSVAALASGATMAISGIFLKAAHIKQVMESLSRPTCFDKSRELIGIHAQLNQFKVEEEVKRLLNQCRDVQPEIEVAVD